jgi:hypothetical protein
MGAVDTFRVGLIVAMVLSGAINTLGTASLRR